MKWISTIICLLLFGCASEKEQLAYYSAIQSRDISVVAEYEGARNDRMELRLRADLQRLEAFNRAMESTENNPVAQVAIAMAFMSQIKDDKFMPEQITLTNIEPPEDVGDVFEAVSPLIRTGLIAGATAWGVSEVMDGLTRPTYQLSDNSSLDINSDNDRSYNTSEGNQSIDAVSNDGDDSAPGDDNTVDTLEECIESPPGGRNSNGDPLWSSGCSCYSHFVDKSC